MTKNSRCRWIRKETSRSIFLLGFLYSTSTVLSPYPLPLLSLLKKWAWNTKGSSSQIFGRTLVHFNLHLTYNNEIWNIILRMVNGFALERQENWANAECIRNWGRKPKKCRKAIEQEAVKLFLAQIRQHDDAQWKTYMNGEWDGKLMDLKRVIENFDSLKIQNTVPTYMETS